MAGVRVIIMNCVVASACIDARIDCMCIKAILLRGNIRRTIPTIPQTWTIRAQLPALQTVLHFSSQGMVCSCSFCAVHQKARSCFSVPACSEDSFTYVTQVLKMLHKYASPPVPLGWMIQGCVVPGGAAKPTHIIGVASSRMCTVLHMFSGVQAFKAGLPGPCGGLRKRRAELWDVKQCKDTRTLIFSSLLPDKVRV